MLGINISQVEVSGISKHGFWLLLDGEEELFVPFSEFPWFRMAPIEQVFHVERRQPHHLYWPELYIDLHVDSIRHPERFPLVSRVYTLTNASTRIILLRYGMSRLSISLMI